LSAIRKSQVKYINDVIGLCASQAIDRIDVSAIDIK